MFPGMGTLGNLFQCFTTIIVKYFFLISSLNLPTFSLKPLPLVLLQQALLKSLPPYKCVHIYVCIGRATIIYIY